MGRVVVLAYDIDVPPPPGPVPCEGQSDLFELRAGRPQMPAFNLCAACTVVDWCRAVVRPEESSYTGVAAGVAWLNGRPIARVASLYGRVVARSVKR